MAARDWMWACWVGLLTLNEVMADKVWWQDSTGPYFHIDPDRNQMNGAESFPTVVVAEILAVHWRWLFPQAGWKLSNTLCYYAYNPNYHPKMKTEIGFASLDSTHLSAHAPVCKKKAKENVKSQLRVKILFKIC